MCGSARSVGWAILRLFFIKFAKQLILTRIASQENERSGIFLQCPVQKRFRLSVCVVNDYAGMVHGVNDYADTQF